jgi:hypothetical protein
MRAPYTDNVVLRYGAPITFRVEPEVTVFDEVGTTYGTEKRDIMGFVEQVS